MTICLCSDCYFGHRCQFYAKGIGLTLDGILRYELWPSMKLGYQSVTMKFCIAVTLVMFFAGLINNALTFLTFCKNDSRKVGCGVYLLASSVTSLLTIIVFMVKFWFLILSQVDQSIERSILTGGCLLIEPTLKFVLYLDSWFNDCVSIERAVTIPQGVHFNKTRSRILTR